MFPENSICSRVHQVKVNPRQKKEKGFCSKMKVRNVLFDGLDQTQDLKKL